ncbi:MAG TPA: hypothetical protein VMB73_15435, partial [Acetobacteraceae bacterium]|nr:hypothetical protein [Acetobacteraceae bacterium]
SLRLVQLGYAAADALGDDRALTPLGFDDTSRIAAQILAHRVRSLFAAATGAHPHMHFVVVPWNGRFSERARADYFPPAGGNVPRYFDDDFDMINTFGRAPQPSALFLPHDPHLSPAGAQLFADRIADVMANADASAANMRTSNQ